MKKYIKPIVVTLSIILVCGFLLAVLSDLLFISDEVKINRAISKIYSESSVTLNETIETDNVDYDKSKGEIKACYKLSNNELLVLSTGKYGYSNGTVTCYIAITSDGFVKKVVQESYKGQTLMGKVVSIYDKYTGFSTSSNPSDLYERNILISGATYSSTAISNSVYTALDFVRKIGG